MSPPAIEISKSSEHTETKKKPKSKTKTKSKPVAAEKEVKAKSSTMATSEKKKSSLLSTFFRPGDRRTKIPALDLPPIERDLSPNTQLRQSESDPLRVPSVQLPKLDFPLPTYKRPEVNMASGSIQQASEFDIPVVNLPSIPDLQLPDVEKQTIDFNIDLMKVPNVQLPDVQYTLNEQDDVKLPEIQFEKTVKTESDPRSAVQAGLALASPVEDMLSIQTDHKNFPIETDYATKAEPIVPIVPTEQPEACIKTEIISIEEKYQVTGLQQAESVVITQVSAQKVQNLMIFDLF